MLNRDINSVLVLLQYGESKWVSQSQLLAGTDISTGDLIDSTLVIRAEQELKVINNLVKAIGDPIRVGIEAASCYSLTCYGMFGYALLASANVRCAIEFGMRYLELTYVFADLQLNILESDFNLSVKLEVKNSAQQAALYRDLFAIFQLIKDVFPVRSGQLGLETQLSNAQLKDIDAFETLKPDFVRGVVFDCMHNAIVGPVAVLDMAFPGAHPGRAQACEALCQQLLQKKRKIQGLSYQIRNVLVRERLQISMDEVAAELCMSPRTLHRKLKNEDTTWRKIRDLVTVDLAEELLKQPLKIDDIAVQLGFSDSANFSHSFKRASGQSPSQFRQRLI